MRNFGVVAVLVMLAALTTPIWKPRAKQFRWFIITTNIGQDLLRRSGLTAGQINDTETFNRLFRDQAKELKRTDRIFSNYLRYSGLGGDGLRGKRILELGPGFNIVVPLRFLAAGAAEAVAADRFVRFQDTPAAQQLYRMVRERLNEAERARFDAAITLEPKVVLKPGRMIYIYGAGIEEVERTWPSHSFHLIVSNAVLEEIYDPDGVFQSMDRLLAPGGYLLHKIDMSDYGMFSKRGFHPLEFLTVPDSVYRFMVESSGQPNRRLINYYRDRLSSLGYSVDLFITGVVGGKPVEPWMLRLEYGVHYDDKILEGIEAIRPRLLERYRQLPDEDLLVSGIFLAGRKPER
jgi:SAM-dependent methyltransferase